MAGVVTCLALAAPASAAIVPSIYWTTGNAVGRANLDGTGVNQAFIGGGNASTGIAVDGQHVYWANFDANTIGRANLDGTGVDQNFITGAGHPIGVAVDRQHVYWVNSAGTVGIGRANLGGGDVNQRFITGLAAPWGLAVDDQHIYFTEQTNLGNTVGRANLDGTGVNRFFILSPLLGVYWVAVDAHHIYWTITSGRGAIACANLDGTGVNTSFITGVGGDVSGLAVTAHIYWGNGSSGTIGRANLDGSGVNRSLIGGLSSPSAVTVIGDAVPTASPSASTLAFGNQPLFRLSRPQPLTVTNTGNGTLEISRAQISSGDVDQFQISSDDCSGRLLAAGDSCQIEVRFGPYTAGPLSAALLFTSNDPASPLTISLSGTGGNTVVGAPGPPRAVLTCKTVTKTVVRTRGHARHKLRVSVAMCTGGLASSTSRFIPGQAMITRGGVIYARGRSLRTRGGRVRLALTESRPLRHGRYTLILRHRQGRHAIVRRVPVRID
ncbi:MAG: choice-of-anchor D domain-containing protein [Mycobacterium sp.]|nr:choice-of-anchor D domain-containing protein [Mycobacterium sp.]